MAEIEFDDPVVQRVYRLNCGLQHQNADLEARVKRLEADLAAAGEFMNRNSELHGQLVDLRDRHQKLEEDTAWCEGDVMAGGMRWQMRWRGELFIGPAESDGGGEPTTCIRAHDRRRR